jgi:hypothetical protein
VVVLFRNKAETDSAMVRIEVMAPGKFKLRSEISGKDIGVFTSDDFVRGVTVPLTGVVEVLEVSAAG